MTINNIYNFGDIVYIISDTDQQKRMVTAIQVSPGEVIYRLSCGTENSWHYDFEVTREKSVI